VSSKCFRGVKKIGFEAAPSKTIWGTFGRNKNNGLFLQNRSLKISSNSSSVFLTEEIPWLIFAIALTFVCCVILSEKENSRREAPR
jgi:hypothetical protein